MVKIKDLSRVDRPREKLIKYGPQKLTTTELLAIILRTGTKSKNVLELAQYILKSIGSEKIQTATFDELRKINGLGNTKSSEILAVIELGKRLLKEKEPIQFISPQHIYESLKEIAANKKEYFVALCLDTKNQELLREVISIGTLNASLVHPREVFEPAIRCLANSIVIVHNHPSGDPTPSREDILITKQLKGAGELLDIHLTDHLIITKSGYVSFKEQALL
jgi:DNA repair protein RadC